MSGIARLRRRWYSTVRSPRPVRRRRSFRRTFWRARYPGWEARQARKYAASGTAHPSDPATRRCDRTDRTDTRWVPLVDARQTDLLSAWTLRDGRNERWGRGGGSHLEALPRADWRLCSSMPIGRYVRRAVGPSTGELVGLGRSGADGMRPGIGSRSKRRYRIQRSAVAPHVGRALSGSLRAVYGRLAEASPGRPVRPGRNGRPRAVTAVRGLCGGQRALTAAVNAASPAFASANSIPVLGFEYSSLSMPA